MTVGRHQQSNQYRGHCKDNIPIIDSITSDDTISLKKTSHITKTEIINNDDFIPKQKAVKQLVDNSSSEDEYHTQNKLAKVIAEVLPNIYQYKYSNTTICIQVHITVVLDLRCSLRKTPVNGLLTTMTKHRRQWFMNKVRHKMGNG